MITSNIRDLDNFYNSTLGRVTCRAIRMRLNKIWEYDKYNQTVVGIGYTGPLLLRFMTPKINIFQLMPQRQGVCHWPKDKSNSSLLMDMNYLPLPDNSVDKIILCHALEFSSDPDIAMHEVSRILKPGGKVIVIVPNRTGLWSWFDNTPFGHGYPYSRLQLQRLFASALLVPISLHTSLFFLPVRNRWFLRFALIWEKISSFLFRPLGGILIMEAEKQRYAPTAVALAKKKMPLISIPQPISTMEQ